MNFKKLAIASATALMFVGAAQAQTINVTDIAQTADVDLTADLAFLNAAGTAITTPVANVISGAVNLATINGAIDISGTNVSLSSLANNVSATANATATTSTADAYAIAGVKLSTTVIGAMNSATVEIASRSEDLASSASTKLGIESLAASVAAAGNVDVGTPGVGNTGTDALSASLAAQAAVFSAGEGDFSLAGLTTESLSNISSKINELQSMSVFNTAINAATLDAGIKVFAAVDPNAWFLNPQTGVVNLSNVAMATTAIGAMNSSVTRLGAGSLSPTIIVK